MKKNLILILMVFSIIVISFGAYMKQNANKKYTDIVQNVKIYENNYKSRPEILCKIGDEEKILKKDSVDKGILVKSDNIFLNENESKLFETEIESILKDIN